MHHSLCRRGFFVEDDFFPPRKVLVLSYKNTKYDIVLYGKIYINILQIF